MITQTDIMGRLRLLRYGLAVLVVVTFLVALLTPYAAVKPVYDAAVKAGATGLTAPSITDSLGTAILVTVIVAVIAVVVYFVYQNILQRTMQKPAA
ncbi:MAG TPA: hypothetical protein VHD90_18495 [Phototrophicaceae bacterium]|nr:hypothetical protein [Phototrophicaceae bacterium]